MELFAKLNRFRRDFHVEFDVAAHSCLLRERSQGLESFSVILALGQHGNMPEYVGDETANQTVASEGGGRDTGIGQKQGDIPASALPEKVGPELCFHDEGNSGLGRVEKTVHGEGEIQGEIAVPDPLTEPVLEVSGAGGSGRGDQDIPFWIAFEQILGQRHCGLDLAHGNSVDPDGPLSARQGGEAKSLPPTGGALAEPSFLEQESENDGRRQAPQQGSIELICVHVQIQLFLSEVLGALACCWGSPSCSSASFFVHERG